MCQQVVADFFVSFGLLIQFLKQGVKVKKQICLFFSAVENAIFFLIIKREAYPFYSYGEIAERRCPFGNLRVVDVRIDNDQIIFGNRIDLVLKQKFTSSISYIKQFSKCMRMGNAWASRLRSGKKMHSEV